MWTGSSTLGRGRSSYALEQTSAGADCWDPRESWRRTRAHDGSGPRREVERIAVGNAVCELAPEARVQGHCAGRWLNLRNFSDPAKLLSHCPETLAAR